MDAITLSLIPPLSRAVRLGRAGNGDGGRAHSRMGQISGLNNTYYEMPTPPSVFIPQASPNNPPIVVPPPVVKPPIIKPPPVVVPPPIPPTNMNELETLEYNFTNRLPMPTFTKEQFRSLIAQAKDANATEWMMNGLMTGKYTTANFGVER